MNAFVILCKAEAQLQWRSGFFIAAVVIAIIWSAVLYFVPAEFVGSSLGLVLSLDISSIALLSCIGLHILEIRQNVANALLVTPMNVRAKLLARVSVISVLSSVTGFIISYPYVSGMHLPLLFIICFCNSLLYAVVGYLLALYKPNISSVIVRLGIVTPIWLLPYLAYLNLYSNVALGVLPTYGVTQLFDVLDGTSGYVHVFHILSWLFWFCFFSAWLERKYRYLVTR